MCVARQRAKKGRLFGNNVLKLYHINWFGELECLDEVRAYGYDISPGTVLWETVVACIQHLILALVARFSYNGRDRLEVINVLALTIWSEVSNTTALGRVFTTSSTV